MRPEARLEVAEVLGGQRTHAVVLADAVELGRVISNLLENARRYGQSPQDGISRVQIEARAQRIACGRCAGTAQRRDRAAAVAAGRRGAQRRLRQPARHRLQPQPEA